MTSENIQIIADLYRAHAERDVPTLLALCHPEIEILQTELLPWGGHYRGTSGMLNFISKLTQYIEGVPEPQQFIEAENAIAVYGRLMGRLKTNNQPFDIRIIHIWTLQDQKVRRFEAFIDTPAILNALEN